MGAFSSFAISFSLISITTGIFANFGHGLSQVGPAMVWSWCVVVVGQLLVALVVGDLAVRFPLSGYGYQWGARLIGPRYGFMVGWLLLLQYLVGFPAICRTLADNLHGFLGGFLAEGAAGLPLTPQWLAVVVITVTAVVHLAGLKPAALVNDVGVVVEIAGTLALTVVLLALFAGPTFPWTVLGEATPAEGPSPATASHWALSLLLGAWCLTGFEGAADLAEETHRPRQTIPRAVVASELSSGIGGFFFLVAFVLAIDDLGAIQASGQPMLEILRRRLPPAVTTGFMLVVMISIFACGVASLAHATRLVFALARDNMLPGSELLKQVHAGTHTPRGAILVLWMLSVLVVLGLEQLALLTSIATVSGYLGYGAIVATALWGRRGERPVEGFQLGRWRGLVSAAALVWTLGVVAALTVPELDGGHRTAWGTLVALALGLAVYVVWIGPRISRGEAGPPPAG